MGSARSVVVRLLVDGKCLPRVPDGGDPDGSVEQDFDLPNGMGHACQDDSGCTQEADYCAYNPISGVGYCSLSDCTQEPDDCPLPYRCYDMSIVMPSLPTVCLNQEDCQALGC